MEGPYPTESGERRRGNGPSSTGSRSLGSSPLHKKTKRSSSSAALFGTVTWILILFSTSFLTFSIGVWVGIQAASGSSASAEKERKLSEPGAAAPPPSVDPLTDAELQRKIEALAKQKVKANLQDLCTKLPSSANNPPPEQNQKIIKGGNLFSRSIEHFAQGLVRVSKDDLMSTFDFGVPPNANTENLDALILYNKKKALPSDPNIAKAARYEDPTKPLPKLSAETATENCDTMNVVLIDNPGGTNQCFALVGGQYQSYHVQRWMRRPDSSYGKMDHKYPLKLTSNGWTTGGRQEFPPPKVRHVKEHQEKLRTYLNDVDNIKKRLLEVLKKMPTKTVVVMTCNHGQSELLMNFACSARARGFDLKNILVFPTDKETKELADGMGFTTFYEETMMAKVPKQEAQHYGDPIFTGAMYAKVISVQLVNELGYDLLFQDVDIVWYKNPLDYFHDKSLPEFDVYFQDDGSRQERYAPYSANSGFYYVRSNDLTKHLFRHMLYQADLIETWDSHQALLVALLGEHNSLMGLRVKIFPKEMEEFPGGLQYHREKESMMKIVKGESKAYIFHMSWTDNKVNKLKFFQQMGEWYLKQQCIGKEARGIMEATGAHGDLIQPCCSAEPIITCHFIDKPSKIPCPDSPKIDAIGKPFWP